MSDATKNDFPVIQVPLSKVAFDRGTQMRARLIDSHIETLKAAYLAGEKLPPIPTVYDGTDYIAFNGHHRGVAFSQVDPEMLVDVEVQPGTIRDALLLAAKANADQDALPRSNADKRTAVTMMRNDAEWSHWSKQQIADACSVSWDLVDAVDKAMGHTSGTGSMNPVTFLHHKTGQPTTMNTSKIGKTRPAADPATGEELASDDDVNDIESEGDSFDDPLGDRGNDDGDEASGDAGAHDVVAAAASTAAGEMEQVVDHFGVVVLQSKPRDAFKLGQRLTTAKRTVTAALKEIGEVLNRPELEIVAGGKANKAIQDQMSGVLTQEFLVVLPYAVCPACDGTGTAPAKGSGKSAPRGCAQCEHTGWITKSVFEQQPQHLRDKHKAMGKTRRTG